MTDAAAIDAVAAIDALHALPLEGFTAARDALAKALAKAGDKPGAAEVKKLKKPTVPSWALNQLSRRHHDEVEVFVAASDRLVRAQLRMMAGGGDDDFAAATRDQRALLQGLIERAGVILSSAGHDPSRALLDRVARTLRATALDEGARAKLIAGRLVEDVEEGGFDALTLQLGAPSAPAPPPPPRALHAVPDPRPEAASEVAPSDERPRAAARAELEAARSVLTAAREAERAARAHLRDVERATAELRTTFETSRVTWDAAKKVEAERRAALEAAEAERRRVEAHKDAAAKSLDAAERSADEARARVIAATEAARDADRALQVLGRSPVP